MNNFLFKGPNNCFQNAYKMACPQTFPMANAGDCKITSTFPFGLLVNDKNKFELTNFHAIIDKTKEGNS